ncbi:hypothetical protein GCM10023322_11820 [Rugosimonospora acidiphila]|uniref:Transposase n=1 Tax=Rugosimonospora acidiphila TaxID=556531 RepID=A0ABP9RM57_9ACTN
MWVGEFPVRCLRVVQHRLHTVAVNLPRDNRVVVHRRSAGQIDAGTGGKKPGEPLGQMPHDVTGRPLGNRGWPVPGAGTADPVTEQSGNLPVPFRRAVRSHRDLESSYASG